MGSPQSLLHPPQHPPLIGRGRPLRSESALGSSWGSVGSVLPGQGPVQPLKSQALEHLPGNFTVGFGNHSCHKGAGHTCPLKDVPLPGWKRRGYEERGKAGPQPVRAPASEGAHTQAPTTLALSEPQWPPLCSGNHSFSANTRGEV